MPEMQVRTTPSWHATEVTRLAAEFHALFPKGWHVALIAVKPDCVGAKGVFCTSDDLPAVLPAVRAMCADHEAPISDDVLCVRRIRRSEPEAGRAALGVHPRSQWREWSRAHGAAGLTDADLIVVERPEAPAEVSE